MCWKISNPYCTRHEMSPEVLAAYLDMPRDANGHTAPIHESYRVAWRKWFERTPKHLWQPYVLDGFKQLDRKKAHEG